MNRRENVTKMELNIYRFVVMVMNNLKLVVMVMTTLKLVVMVIRDFFQWILFPSADHAQIIYSMIARNSLIRKQFL